MHGVVLDYILLVVVPQGSGQLVKVHDRIAFSDAPQSGQLDRVDDSEFESVSGPRKDWTVFTISEKFEDELPQLNSVTS